MEGVDSDRHALMLKTVCVDSTLHLVTKRNNGNTCGRTTGTTTFKWLVLVRKNITHCLLPVVPMVVISLRTHMLRNGRTRTKSRKKGNVKKQVNKTEKLNCGEDTRQKSAQKTKVVAEENEEIRLDAAWAANGDKSTDETKQSDGWEEAPHQLVCEKMYSSTGVSCWPCGPTTHFRDVSLRCHRMQRQLFMSPRNDSKWKAWNFDPT